MTTTSLKARLLTRADTLVAWSSANPILGLAEFGVVLDEATSMPTALKIGDGITAWDTLPYFGGSQSSAPGVDTIPIGVEMFFSGNTPPDGWLVENGAVLSREQYPELWAHAQTSGMLVSDSAWNSTISNRSKFSSGDGTSTFRLPDLTTDGLFVRAQAGADSSFGRRQEDDLKAHTHGVNDPGHSHSVTDPGHRHQLSRSFNTGVELTIPTGGSSSGSDGGEATFNAPTGIGVQIASANISLNASGGAETRPKNAGRLPIIKALRVAEDATAGGIVTLDTLAFIDTDAVDIMLPGGYRRYHIQIDELYGSVDSSVVYLRLSTNEGGAFVSTGYAYQRHGVHENVIFNEGRRNLDTAPGILISAYLGTSKNHALSGEITLISNAAKTICSHRTQHERSTGWMHMSTGSGWINLPAVNAARLYTDGGIVTGTITVKGER